MVYLANVSQVRATFNSLVGKAEYLTSSFVPDASLAIQMANLRPGERVLDLGTGGGEVLAAAKTAVQAGLCIGLDAVQGFLDVDVPHRLARSHLTVAPAGTDAQKVYLVRGSVTNGTLPNLIQQRVGQPAKFDVIFVLHVFNTIPPIQRRQALLTWKRLLADGGRIIVSMSARFGRASDVQGPVQFAARDLTEAPGCIVNIAADPHAPVRAADNSLQARRTIIAGLQLAPDRLWQVAHKQADAAAANATLRVVASREVGKGDQFGLAPGVSSPTPSTLVPMSPDAIVRWMESLVILGRQCWGRVYQSLARNSVQGWGTMPADIRDAELGLQLQRAAIDLVQDADERRAQLLANPSPTQRPSIAVHHQVGVLVELRV